MSETRIAARREGIDANIFIEKRGPVFMFDFLARGNSQKRKNGKVIGYRKRNPERSQLLAAILEALELQHPGFSFLGSTYGKGAQFDPTLDVRSAFRKAGNFRFCFWVSLSEDVTVQDLMGSLELERSNNKPTPGIWPDAI